ncbi:hypothetical protein ALC56_02064, partial [Trachymyrmex septentrionalis]
SDLRTADAYILSGFHPTCLSNGPAQAIKTDYSAPRERGERETHGYPYTEPDLHRTMNPLARACGLIFHLDVARAAVASGSFSRHHSIFHLLIFLQSEVKLPTRLNHFICLSPLNSIGQKTKKLRRDKERERRAWGVSFLVYQGGRRVFWQTSANFCVLPVRLPWEGNLIIKNRRKSGTKRQMKKNMILQRGNVRENGVARISSYERGGRAHNDWQVEENQTNYFERAAFSKMGLRLFSRLEAVILLLFPGVVSNPRLVSSTRRKRIDRVSPTPVVNRIRATIIGHDLRTYFGRCELHSTKWDKSSPFVKAELNVGSNAFLNYLCVISSVLLRSITAYMSKSHVEKSNSKTGNDGAAGVESEERMQVAQVALKEVSRDSQEGKLGKYREKPTERRREIRTSGKQNVACKLQNVKLELTIKGHRTILASVAVLVVLEYVRICAQMQSELRWKLGYNPSKKGSVAGEVETENIHVAFALNLIFVKLYCDVISGVATAAPPPPPRILKSRGYAVMEFLTPVTRLAIANWIDSKVSEIWR